MNDSIVRFQYNPALTDTVGFFDYCVPLTKEWGPPPADTLLKFSDYTVYDYVTPIPPSQQLTQTTSLFTPHALRKTHNGPLPVTKQPTDWITIVFVCCLFIFAWVQSSYSKRLAQIYRAVAQPYFVNQLEREGNLFKERIMLGLGAIYYAVSSLFIFQICREFDVIPSGINNLTFTAVIFLGVIVGNLLKFLAVYITGVIFLTHEASRQYSLNILIFNHIIGLILFPITVFSFYYSNIYILLTGSIIISLLMAYRFFRGILIGLQNKNYNLFYLFLYLCTLEILPLLFIYAILSNA